MWWRQNTEKKDRVRFAIARRAKLRRDTFTSLSMRGSGVKRVRIRHVAPRARQPQAHRRRSSNRGPLALLAFLVCCAAACLHFLSPPGPSTDYVPRVKAHHLALVRFDVSRPTPGAVVASLDNVQLREAAPHQGVTDIPPCAPSLRAKPAKNRTEPPALFGRTGLPPLVVPGRRGAPRVAPLLTGGSGDLLCFAERDTRQARGLRHQSFCLVQRLCHTARNTYVLPLPRNLSDAAAAVLRAQPRLVVADESVVSGFSLDRRMAFFSGLDTAHFAEWVDGPLFMWAYQHHAWRFGASQVRPSCGIGGGL